MWHNDKSQCQVCTLIAETWVKLGKFDEKYLSQPRLTHRIHSLLSFNLKLTKSSKFYFRFFVKCCHTPEERTQFPLWPERAPQSHKCTNVLMTFSVCCALVLDEPNERNMFFIQILVKMPNHIRKTECLSVCVRKFSHPSDEQFSWEMPKTRRPPRPQLLISRLCTQFILLFRFKCSLMFNQLRANESGVASVIADRHTHTNVINRRTEAEAVKIKSQRCVAPTECTTHTFEKYVFDLFTQINSMRQIGTSDNNNVCNRVWVRAKCLPSHSHSHTPAHRALLIILSVCFSLYFYSSQSWTLSLFLPLSSSFTSRRYKMQTTIIMDSLALWLHGRRCECVPRRDAKRHETKGNFIASHFRRGVSGEWAAIIKRMNDATQNEIIKKKNTNNYTAATAAGTVKPMATVRSIQPRRQWRPVSVCMLLRIGISPRCSGDTNINCNRQMHVSASFRT